MRVGFYVAANVLLILIGGYLAGGTALVTRLEAIGRGPWQRISRLSGRVLPANTLPRALAAGAIWGWLPCGLAYSIIAIALVSGSAARGAGLMAAFGLGTLPTMLAAGWFLAHRQFRGPAMRRASGVLVMAFGVAGLVHATWLADQIRRGVLCIT